jgi:hypothetical protein
MGGSCYLQKRKHGGTKMSSVKTCSQLRVPSVTHLCVIGDRRRFMSQLLITRAEGINSDSVSVKNTEKRERVSVDR